MQKYLRSLSIFLIGAFLLSGCGIGHDESALQQKYKYYDDVLTVGEIHKIQANKELHGLTYNEPIDGIYGSYWDTSEEAEAATLAYMREQGLTYTEGTSESASPPAFEDASEG